MVITSTIGNRVAVNAARGFESLLLRQRENPLSCNDSAGFLSLSMVDRVRSIVFALVGIQNDASHTAEDAAHGKDPPGGVPQIFRETQSHINGGGRQHDTGAEGTDQILLFFGLRGGVVVPVVLPNLIFVILDPAIDEGRDCHSDNQQKYAAGQGLIGLPLRENAEKQDQQDHAEQDRAHAARDVPDEFLLKSVLFFLGIEVCDDGYFLRK